MFDRLKNSIILFIFGYAVHAHAQSRISLNVETASLPEVIDWVAKAIPLSVSVSKAVQGAVTVHWDQVDPEAALDVLLATNGLMRTSYHGLWYVATPDELIQKANREQKWQVANEAVLPLETHVYQVRYAKAKELAAFLESGKQTALSKRGAWRVDERTNTLAVTDIQPNLRVVDQWVHALDVPVKQILIEARLASVDQAAESALGLAFSTTTAKTSASPSGFYSIAIASLPDGSRLDVQLAALARAGKAELIASPRLFTVNLRSASIESGEEVPYQEVSESGGTAIAFKKAVLGLQVLPQLLPGGRVMLALKINQDRPGALLTQGVPLIDTREITTEVLVKHGQTVVLGGIYEDDHETEVSRLPYLSALPFMGRLFQVNTEVKRKRELLIFVTPKLIAS